MAFFFYSEGLATSLVFIWEGDSHILLFLFGRGWPPINFSIWEGMANYLFFSWDGAGHLFIYYLGGDDHLSIFNFGDGHLFFGNDCFDL